MVEAKKTTEEVAEENTEKQEENIPVIEDSKEEIQESEETPKEKEEAEAEAKDSTENTPETEKVEEASTEEIVKEKNKEETPIEEVADEKVDEVKEITRSTKEEQEEKEDDFDWDKLDSSDYDEKQWKDLEQEYLSTLSSVEEKKVFDGTVVRVTDREVIVDINFKSDGVIGRTEFRYNPDLKAGDIVEVLIEKQEDKNGQLILSHRRARVLRAWEKVNTAEDTGEIVEGTIQSRTKGGMIVEVFGIEAFLPGSQIDVKPIRDYDEYVGKKMEFKVLKVNESFRNVVVSHKALIEADLEEQKKEIMSKLEKG